MNSNFVGRCISDVDPDPHYGRKSFKNLNKKITFKFNVYGTCSKLNSVKSIKTNVVDQDPYWIRIQEL